MVVKTEMMSCFFPHITEQGSVKCLFCFKFLSWGSNQQKGFVAKEKNNRELSFLITDEIHENCACIYHSMY